MSFRGFTIRGLFSVWLSRAMENLAAEINAKHPHTIDVTDHGTWPFNFGNVNWITEQCVDLHKFGHKLVLIGHSFGATSAIMVTNALAKRKIDVDLLCPIDPAIQYSTAISPNAKRIIGFYQKEPFQLGQGVLTPGPGWTNSEWRARAVDYRREESHLAIADDKFVHQTIIKAVDEL